MVKAKLKPPSAIILEPQRGGTAGAVAALGIGKGDNLQNGATPLTKLPSDTGDRIPPHVAAVLAECGDIASVRLLEVLAAHSFTELRAGEQAGFIRLAFEYAYGRPQNAVKTSVNLNINSESGDAVTAALARLAALADADEAEPAKG